VHLPQLLAHDASINTGFLGHSPEATHSAHPGLLSTHGGHLPQLLVHDASMKTGFFAHSPVATHPAHPELLSRHARARIKQLSAAICIATLIQFTVIAFNGLTGLAESAGLPGPCGVLAAASSQHPLLLYFHCNRACSFHIRHGKCFARAFALQAAAVPGGC
jgi:hypothetical protein